ncbi:inactive pancreatic lipase-related protein 1-like isoform X2 [Penaeus chinensis]|uniref:inactive pancreatic lipase-related protein 1-like isoform X2 n=1 Tax=Penaeus chinensis TaxID=139456 RepID=UPI001FB7FB93|nr:inactive pancreatic lipase-related protein 1-like isoform X2 [Penaeus chinensis]
MYIMFNCVQGWRQAGSCRILWVAMAILASGVGRSSQQDYIDRVFGSFQDVPLVLRALTGSLLGPPAPPSSTAQDRRDHSAAPATPDSTSEIPATYCVQELGCLLTGPGFRHPKRRPINLPPDPRHFINVAFNVFTRENIKGVRIPAKEMPLILKSSFDPLKRTKIIVHGYLNGRDMPYLLELASAFLYTEDVNVIYVDWTEGAIRLYNRAVANARVVGLEIAHLVTWLGRNAGLQAKDVHLIGHSLGAHVCGYAGERVPGLGRITGLDPAKPLFEQMPPEVRLDPSDALLVDAIHTDAHPLFFLGQGYGITHPVGHLDFYPNGGEYQPGCTPALVAPVKWLLSGARPSTAKDAVTDALGCNHVFAVKVFTNSIISSCPFTAFRCPSYRDYEQGRCFSCGPDGTGCASLGVHADKWRGEQTGVALYLKTFPEPYLCLFHHLLRVEFGRREDATRSLQGRLNATLAAQGGRTVTFDLTSRIMQLQSTDTSLTFMLEDHQDLSAAKEALVTWNAGWCGRACEDSVTITKVTVQNVEKSGQRRQLGRSAQEGCQRPADTATTLPNGGTVKVPLSQECQIV